MTCASRSPCPVTGGHVRLGVSICEDLWDEFYDIKPLAELAAKGADVLLNLNASPFCPGKRHERDEIIRRHLAVAAQAARLHQHDRRRGQRQEHHPVRWRKPGLRCGWTPDRHRPAVRGTAPDRRPRRVRQYSPAVQLPAHSIAIGKCTTAWSWRFATTCARPASTAPSSRCRAASTRRWRSPSRSMRSGPIASRPTTCRRASTATRRDRSPTGWRGPAASPTA